MIIRSRRIASMKKRAFITGITGQDGSYLAELLVKKRYRVFGLEQRGGKKNRERAAHRADGIIFLSGDLADARSLRRALATAEPHEVYHLAAQSSAVESFQRPVYTGEITGIAAAQLLEITRVNHPHARFFQASSAEIFGGAPGASHNEHTAYYPRSPYGAAKLYAHSMARIYRERYHLFVCNGILFNHESPRRGENFVTRKIALAAARVKLRLLRDKLHLGDLDTQRDWGFAGDYVEAMWLMLQQPEPRDYVIATGKLHSVRDFVQEAFLHVGLDWREYIQIDQKLARSYEQRPAAGDASAARRVLKWKPRTQFRALVRMMVDAELTALSRG